MSPFGTVLSATLSLFVTIAAAQDIALPPPTGTIILTVTGLDHRAFSGGNLQFDLENLKALGESQISTTSIWTDGQHRYSGIMLARLAQYLQLGAGSLQLHALNDYAVQMPVQEATDAGPLLAYQMDGSEMTVRDKGPIWVVYPYDAGPQFRTDETFARSVWQLDRIDVLK